MLSKELQDFLRCTTRRELAHSLGFKYKDLIYNLFKLPEDQRYKEFLIPKRNGKERLICSPISGIKTLQKRISNYLLEIYKVKPCVHSYIKNRGILSNAKPHIKKRVLINLDLQDFFPSIHFGRVRGMFKSHPFNFNDEVATTLAQICCYKKTLPQGAPSSPIISNFICRKLDNELLNYAKINKATYTRYADDITFSTSILPVPENIGIISTEKFQLNNNIINIITKNNFEINTLKTRYARKNNRQEVTGLIVNKFPNVERKYIKYIRALLHSCEKYKLAEAANFHFKDRLLYNIDKNKMFVRMLAGKIGFVGMVRGKDDPIYQRLRSRLLQISPHVKLPVIFKNTLGDKVPIIMGEGKSDVKHLEAAFKYFKSNHEFPNLNLYFYNYEKHSKPNNDTLLKFCRNAKNFYKIDHPCICFFDSDEKKINELHLDQKYLSWGNNFFSFILPKPSHRVFNQISIEFLYTDQEIMTYDSNKRRLYISKEFDKTTGKHLSEPLNYKELNKLQKKRDFIIDSNVFSEKGVNIALPKDDFACNIIKSIPPFDEFTFEHFKPIFKIIENIINDNCSNV
ncbi:MAG: reverse transcriptase domain-containing protein [bacterium]